MNIATMNPEKFIAFAVFEYLLFQEFQENLIRYLQFALFPTNTQPPADTQSYLAKVAGPMPADQTSSDLSLPPTDRQTDRQHVNQMLKWMLHWMDDKKG